MKQTTDNEKQTDNLTYTIFKHGKNISYKTVSKNTSDLHVCRVGVRGEH